MMGSMEVQKRSSKGGGFLNLFDWNSKSRKKLFSDSSETPECANQGNVEPRILPGTRLLQTNAANENANSFNSGRIDWNSNPSSSLMSGEGHGGRAPGVVARLMGLDLMPTSDVPESCSTSFPNFNIPRGSPYYSKLEAFTRDPRIERFQTEVLPPRSAKPISLTHHKLLSPVKNPAFVPTKNAAYIIEAAARIIEASPKEAMRGKASPTISSSVPLRIQDLKAKLEAQQPKRPSNFKIMNGKSNDRSPQRMLDARTNRRGVESEKGNIPRSSSGRTRLFSPVEQTKANMQRREGKNQTSNRNLPTDRGLKSSQRRASMNKGTNNVLKQNNQKQNSVSERIGSVSKASSGPKIGRNETRTVNKIPAYAESTSSRTVKTNSHRNLSPSSTKTLTKKKGVYKKEISSTRSIATNVLVSNDERSMKSKIGADVISFTFTSPIKGSLEAQSPVRTVASINNFASGKSLTFLSPAESVIGESSLSILLEQKLRELKDRVESYGADSSYVSTASLKEEDSASTCTSSIQDSVYTASAQVGPDRDEINVRKFQVAEDNEECSASATSNRKKFDHQLQSVSDLEPLFTAGSSPASTVTCVESLEVEDSRTELSETTSCSSIADVRENYAALASSNVIHFNLSSNWEIEYIRDIISEAESMLEDRSTTHPAEIIDPSLFDELESRGNGPRRNSEEEPDKLRRKILFNFASECLVLRCRDFLIGTPKGWASFTALFRRKSLLADEIYREVSCGNCIGDMMVDVLVDEDMSSKYGRWVDFRVEMFEEGSDIGQGILSSLVDEMVAEYVMLSS